MLSCCCSAASASSSDDLKSWHWPDWQREVTSCWLESMHLTVHRAWWSTDPVGQMDVCWNQGLGSVKIKSIYLFLFPVWVTWMNLRQENCKRFWNHKVQEHASICTFDLTGKEGFKKEMSADQQKQITQVNTYWLLEAKESHSFKSFNLLPASPTV